MFDLLFIQFSSMTKQKSVNNNTDTYSNVYSQSGQLIITDK